MQTLQPIVFNKKTQGNGRKKYEKIPKIFWNSIKIQWSQWL